MSYSLFHRSISLSLAAVLTLSMLGGIDRLAQRDEQTAGWAKSAPQVAPATRA